jgi:hypothetical protein
MRKKLPHERHILVSKKEATNLILRYVKNRVAEQFKAAIGIIVYLILFQIIVLGIPLMDSSVIALGMMMFILGLTFFLEGLLLGIMPMGEEIGVRLPQKIGVTSILLIGFVLGVGATLAEPAMAVLKVAGSSVQAWNAPLLFLMLNRYAAWLVAAVGFGVGIALVLSIIRFLRGHSLKPYLYVIVSLLLALSLYAWLDPNLKHLLGLAWDCGPVTTGPVTVPLVLALGIGISHVANRGGSKTEGGFGMVTLALLLPVIAVIVLGIILSFNVPAAQSEVDFFSESNPRKSYLFEDDMAMRDYVIGNAGYAAQLQLFSNDEKELMAYVAQIGIRQDRIGDVFGSDEGFRHWLLENGDDLLKERFSDLIMGEIPLTTSKASAFNRGVIDQLRRNIGDALRAIVPLSLFLLGVLYLILRERLQRPDEVILGLLFAIIGMTLFGGGIELGLSKVGDQVGSNLPVSFSEMQYPEGQRLIKDFDEGLINTAIKADGSQAQFFYLEDESQIISVAYEPIHHDFSKRLYRYIPSRGPLFGRTDYSMLGILVVMLFAFVMGFSATLAEPALNALGLTVEDLTVGAFKKTMLLKAVAIGVGVGLSLGVARIIWDLPLFWFLGPLYLVLLLFTWLSTEDFVNIGWDSAGVTTGPITVPLVLSMGLGIGGQVGVVEGFGILSLASACPIISVLGMGLYVNHKRKALLKEYEADADESIGKGSIV